MNSFRDWLNTLFGSDGGRAVQMLFALLLVVLLILAVTWLFRRLFGATLHRNRSQRLQLVDSAVIDPHRRLLLLRRDDVEHLVMVGGPNDVLVESRILKAPPVLAVRAVAQPMPQPMPQPIPQPAAQPVTAPAPQPAIQAAPRPPIVPIAEPEPPIPAPAAAEPAAPAITAVRAKAAAGAASVAAAVASAGALLRARIGRAEESEPATARAPLAETRAPEARTFDEAFDAPLGRGLEPPAPPRPAPLPPIPEPVAPARFEPPRPAPLPPAPEPELPPLDLPPIDLPRFDLPSFELPRLDLPPVEPPRPEPAPRETVRFEPAAPPPRPAPRDDLFADGLARALAEVAPVEPPPPRAAEIDLLADLEAIGSEIARAPRPHVEPVPAGEPEPVAPVVAEDFAPLEPAPLRTEPRFEAAAEATSFDFGFDFEPSEPPAVAAVTEPEPALEPEPAVEPEPAPAEAVEDAPAEDEPAIEIVRTPEPPAAVEPAPEPPAAKPAPVSSVDELEEEMARLLAELSGQTRR